MNREELEQLQGKLLSMDTSKSVSVVEKNGQSLSYISWADAWRDVIKVCPDADYEVMTFDGLPYIKQEEGYMVQTKVTIAGVTRMMWLPVMDSRNKAMKSQPYEIKTRNGSSVQIPSATMTDINKTIMRCLVKNIAMFGYGLNVYQGDDLPNVDEPEYIKPQEHCSECGEVITDAKKKDGTIVRAETIIENSKSMYHRVLCAKCLTKQIKTDNAKAEGENK